MKSLISFCLLLLMLNVFAIDSSKGYYSLLSSAENQIMEMNLDSAMYYYDLAFQKFGTPFYKHVKQAAIIAKFKGGENKYLAKCVEKGMSKIELELFKSCSNYHEVKENYQMLRQKYISKIDTILMEKFSEYDIVDVDVNMLDYKGKHREHDSIHALMINRYIKLINENGFPTESKVGLARVENLYPKAKNCTPPYCFNAEIKDLLDLKLEKTSIYYNSKEWTGYGNMESMRPGNSFLWHYGGIPEKDTTLIALLEEGIHTLKILPENLVFYYEYSSSKSNSHKYDMACGYKSDFFLKVAKGKAGTYRFSRDIKDKINLQRKKFFIRSIDKEEKLFYALFELETGKKAKIITKKTIKKIRNTNNAFLSYI